MRFVFIGTLFVCATCSLFAQQGFHLEPTAYSNNFSSRLAPVLRVKPGDTVHTSSVDAGGRDKFGNQIAQRGNPLTGPFFIEDATPGDIIAITITQISLNRDFATTLNALIPKVVNGSAGKKNWRSAKLVRWKLDLQRMEASPMDPSPGLTHIRLPLHPFLGCIGVAAESDQEISSGASGFYGGNLDFKYNTAGATIYLPVFHTGALVYLGDGHAAQGDGELNGDALETSMDFSFTARVLKPGNFPLQTPMVENSEYLMFFGIESSLEKSLQVATTALCQWLEQRYQLNTEQISQVIGPSIEYRIPKIAATKVEVVAMIPKNLLEQLKF